MRFYSTSHEIQGATLFEALTQGFAPEGGLYLPSELPFFSPDELTTFRELSLTEISFLIMKRLLGDEFSQEEIRSLAQDSFSFPIPLVAFPDHVYALELFHGPTLSFKDFGAGFLARLTQHLWKGPQPLTVLVATTGDTGSAVGTAFHGIPNTHVYILFPKGTVTPAQEKQLTTIGGNVTAIEVDGTFDDCQKLLKQAVLDPELRKTMTITTGNSINAARLLPQALYFFYAYSRMQKGNNSIVVAVPCGNFGHLVSAILAKRMGLPIARFVAATNINDEIPLFLKSGVFRPHPSWPSIAVSMDVGNPSNFPRFTALYQNSLELMRHDIVGISFSDEEIRQGIQEMYAKTGYILDPHSAAGYLALRDYRAIEGAAHEGLFVVTAHPAKFVENVQPLIKEVIPIPTSLQSALSRKKESIVLSNRYDQFKEYLLRGV